LIKIHKDQLINKCLTHRIYIQKGNKRLIIDNKVFLKL